MIVVEDLKLIVVKGMQIETEMALVRRGRLSFGPRKLGAGRRANQSEYRTLHKQDTTLACGSWLDLRFSGIASSALRVVRLTMKFLRDRSSGEHLATECKRGSIPRRIQISNKSQDKV